MIKKSIFGKLDGREVILYSLTNKSGTKINIINFGAVITNLFTADRNDNIDDIVLGYDSFNGYLNDKSFMGAIVGRYGNRISQGRFQIKNQKFQLSINDGNNHLHGGLKGFNKYLWNVESFEHESGDCIKLTYVSHDGEEGYPGTVILSVSYTLTDGDELKINYEATTDKTTIINPTHHSYFNLSGNFDKSILEHQLQIEADNFIPIDASLIPAGAIENVNNTPMDFRSLIPIGFRINDKSKQLEYGNGYDHTWALNNFNGLTRKVASLYDPSTGRFMEVLTDQPGLQFYSGNSLDESTVGKGEIKFKFRGGLCLEAQFYPDSPNNPLFPSTILNPGEIYKQETIYKFSVR